MICLPKSSPVLLYKKNTKTSGKVYKNGKCEMNLINFSSIRMPVERRFEKLKDLEYNFRHAY